MGKCRLFDHNGEWYFHIVATRDIEEREISSVETLIEIGIGEASLLTVCHRGEHGSPTASNLWNGKGMRARQLRETYFTTTQRLQKRGSERITESYGGELWRHIDYILHTVTSGIVSYAGRFENPVLVLESLTHVREDMGYGAFMNRRLHGWGFTKMHTQIRCKTSEKGIRVETVNPVYTSKACHCCGEAGYRPKQATFKCSNSACWVSKYQADIDAALSIADRYLSGESHSREHTDGGDSAEEGGHLTVPQDNQANADTQQGTLGTYAS